MACLVAPVATKRTGEMDTRLTLRVTRRHAGPATARALRAGIAVVVAVAWFGVFGSASRAQVSGGLVAAYAFNEGAGTSTADLSGSGNAGTIAGATWTTQGKFGNALSFNGTSARVTVADAPSLR